MRVAVIGAGAVGSNIAFRLIADGHDVTIIDAGRPGQGTTGTSISWLSAFPQVAAAGAEDLDRRLTINQMFAELDADLGGSWMHWADTLTWAADPVTGGRLRADWEICAQRGVDVDLISGKEARTREPALAIQDGAEVYAERGGGWVDAPLLVQALLTEAARRGATVREQTAVTGIEQDDGQVTAVTTASGQHIQADVVVNAAGSWASHVAALAGCPVPLDLRPGLIVYAGPLPHGGLRHVLSTPALNIRPEPGSGVAIHCRAESMYGHHDRNAERAADVIGAAARWLPGLREAPVRAARVGIRPVPPGGPVIGFHPALAGLYIAVSHGGIGWGPVWGQIAAREISGHPVAGLDRWRPDRFLAGAADITEGEISCA